MSGSAPEQHYVITLATGTVGGHATVEGTIEPNAGETEQSLLARVRAYSCRLAGLPDSSPVIFYRLVPNVPIGGGTA
ncbi:hypothetical protein [Streptomyces sp. NBC_00212]|uniref:hypothetical protein n=1 Tax=Streptomyces sp. NBC_00212 TaxID=2975684 RepID=UPI002F90F0ED